MNSQCNGSFLPKWQETRAGTDALPYTVCFCCPVFWGQAPLSPQDAHVGPRWANWYPRDRFTTQGPIATCAKPACSVKNPRFKEILR